MGPENRISLACAQAAVLRYVRIWTSFGYRVAPVPVGQPLRPGQGAWFILHQN